MGEHPCLPEGEIADELLDLLPRLLQRIRADIPREIDPELVQPEWRDISELRATTGQVRLLRVLIAAQRCTMQKLAEQLDVAPPTVTAMVKRLLSQGFVERLHDEEDWRMVWILPTERGQRAVAMYDQLRRASLQRRLAHLTQEEQAQLRVSLPILRHLIEVES